MRTYNLPLAVCAVAAILYTKLNERRELMAFRVISSKKKKFVITHGNSGESSLEKTAFREYIDENDEIFGVGRTHFVEDFVRRSETPGTLSGVLGILLPAALIAAAVFFALGYYRAGGSSFSENLATAMSASQVCLSFLLPSCSFAVYALPFYKAATESYRADAAIVGDAAFEEYADAAVISFNDEEVFPEGTCGRAVCACTGSSGSTRCCTGCPACLQTRRTAQCGLFLRDKGSGRLRGYRDHRGVEKRCGRRGGPGKRSLSARRRICVRGAWSL